MKSRTIILILILFSLASLAVGVTLQNKKDNSINTNILVSRPVVSGINNSVFLDLPEYPSNFDLMKRNFESNQVQDSNRLTANYYKQPEFYPSWKQCTTWFTNHDNTRWGVHGFGAYPAERDISVINMSTGNSFDTFTFFKTSCGIETWQGLHISISHNTSLFDVTVSPNEILLEPTYPKFYTNWTYFLNIRVTALKKIPAGDYDLSMDISNPSKYNDNKWVWEVFDENTNYAYTTEVKSCIDSRNINSTDCINILKMRQNKYISGGSYRPDILFDIKLHVE
jgi:hypothetical protein